MFTLKFTKIEKHLLHSEWVTLPLKPFSHSKHSIQSFVQFNSKIRNTFVDLYQRLSVNRRYVYCKSNDRLQFYYFGCSASGGSCSIEGKAKRFVSVSHFGVLSADVQRSNSMPESGETPI